MAREPLAPRRGALPGFSLTLGITLGYLGLLVLLPLGALLLKCAGLSLAQLVASVTAPRALAAYRLSLGASLLAALVNAVFGLLVAWVLTRHRFPGRALFDALIDLPFALPTAIGGIALTTLYTKTGWIGGPLWRALGVQVAFTRAGIVVALIFVGLPFVVRTLQPVLEELDSGVEEAAATLGASGPQIFLRVILPSLRPPLLAGFALAFARALGEYGSVVFIAGNLPMKTEIAPLLIMTRLEQYDHAGATAVAVVMLALSGALLALIHRLQAHSSRPEAAAP